MTTAEARVLIPCLTFQLAEQAEWVRLWDVLIDVREAFCDCLSCIVANNDAADRRCQA